MQARLHVGDFFRANDKSVGRYILHGAYGHVRVKFPWFHEAFRGFSGGVSEALSGVAMVGFKQN